MGDLTHLLDVLNKFVVPILGIMWMEIRSGRNETKAVIDKVHLLDKRVVRAETTLQLTPLEE